MSLRPEGDAEWLEKVFLQNSLQEGNRAEGDSTSQHQLRLYAQPCLSRVGFLDSALFSFLLASPTS